MTVRLQGKVVALDGDCRVEDAETLLGLLREDGARAVDISAVRHLHAAVLQILLWRRPEIIGSSADRFVQNWLRALFM